MRPHTKIYLDFFGYTIADFIPCECCGARAVDINHIDARGMGGSKTKDTIENLMAVCRACHHEFGDIKGIKDVLKMIHAKVIEQRGGFIDIRLHLSEKS